jgi:hypothetical protein
MKSVAAWQENLNSPVLRGNEGQSRDISGIGFDDRVEYGYPRERTP